jgi:molecular chaperone GrpE (heat shock protein)
LEKEKVQKLKGLEAGNGEIENQLDRMQQEIDELRKALEDKEQAITEREKGESIAIA